MPPGGTIEMVRNEIAGKIVERLKPYMDHEKQPYIRGYNLSAFGAFNMLFISCLLLKISNQRGALNEMPEMPV